MASEARPLSASSEARPHTVSEARPHTASKASAPCTSVCCILSCASRRNQQLWRISAARKVVACHCGGDELSHSVRSRYSLCSALISPCPHIHSLVWPEMLSRGCKPMLCGIPFGIHFAFSLFLFKI
eukprot:2833321-Pleurochrysis_carterae.AAC.3